MSADIRIATSSDAPAIAEIYRPIVLSTPISFEIEPPDEQEIQRRIEETLPAHPWLVCEDRGRIAGYAYASRHRVRAAYLWSVDTSVYIHPDFHRCGIGRALYLTLFQILMLQGYFNAYAGITLPNPASVGLHESLGFKAMESIATWPQVGSLVRRRLVAFGPPSPVATPRPPLSLDQVQADSQWPRILASGLSVIRPRA